VNNFRASNIRFTESIHNYHDTLLRQKQLFLKLHITQTQISYKALGKGDIKYTRYIA